MILPAVSAFHVSSNLTAIEESYTNGVGARVEPEVHHQLCDPLVLHLVGTQRRRGQGLPC